MGNEGKKVKNPCFSGKEPKFNLVQFESESAAGPLRENPGPGAEI